MFAFAVLTTLIFFLRFLNGIQRLNRPPKTVMFYNHKADMVEMCLNMIVAVIGLALLIHSTLIAPVRFICL